MICEQTEFIQQLNNISLSVEDVLAKLRVPRNRLHLDETDNLVVGPERKGKGLWRTYLFIDRIAVSEQSACWPWLGATWSDGYGCITVTKKKPKHIAAHRAVFSLVFGSIPNGLCVRHKCDNPICCNPFHLELGTHSDNMQDAVKRGRMDRSGERNGRHKLTAEEIPQIRKMFQSGHTKAEIARRFTVSPSAIGWVLNGKGWKGLS